MDRHCITKCDYAHVFSQLPVLKHKACLTTMADCELRRMPGILHRNISNPRKWPPHRAHRVNETGNGAPAPWLAGGVLMRRWAGLDEDILLPATPQGLVDPALIRSKSDTGVAAWKVRAGSGRSLFDPDRRRHGRAALSPGWQLLVYPLDGAPRSEPARKPNPSGE